MIKARSKPFFWNEGRRVVCRPFFQNPIFKGEENSRRPDPKLEESDFETQHSRRVSKAKSNLRLKILRPLVSEASQIRPNER